MSPLDPHRGLPERIQLGGLLALHAREIRKRQIVTRYRGKREREGIFSAELGSFAASCVPARIISGLAA